MVLQGIGQFRDTAIPLLPGEAEVFPGNLVAIHHTYLIRVQFHGPLHQRGQQQRVTGAEFRIGLMSHEVSPVGFAGRMRCLGSATRRMAASASPLTAMAIQNTWMNAPDWATTPPSTGPNAIIA